MNDDPLQLVDFLQSLYLKYIDSALPLRDEALAGERRALLARPGVLFQEPRLEPLPLYRPHAPLAASCAELGLPAEFADFAARGLFPPGRPLYEHQHRALKAAVEGRHFVVTTGTGSGKTECFLLPLFAALLRESSSWPADRLRGVRALILYPLNALVEDQMVRLRQAADSVDNPTRGRPGARSWLAAHRSGHRFYFGRYTGRTPVSGWPTQPRRELHARRRSELQDQARRVAGDLRLRYQFPAMDGAAAEMWDRWGMQKDPPDVLVTNYSMLNIMLMREIEEDIFDQTRRWLAADRRHIFHLVVDELHAYRGTQGTEVAYLIRLLLHRLGLGPSSPQVSFMASSASLDERQETGEGEPLSHRYLQGFFGVPWSAERFEIIAGEPSQPQPSHPSLMAGRADVFTPFREQWRTAPADAVAALAARLGMELPPGAPPVALRAVLEGGEVLAAVREGYERPETPGELGGRVFGPGADRGAVAGLLNALCVARLTDDPEARAPLPWRMHLFHRNLPGLWACVDPHCPDAPRDPEGVRPVGRLHTTPQLVCTCGSRVLDLVVCQICGELYLGGFRRREEGEEEGPTFLVHDQPALERAPEPAMMPRRHGQYAIFWPVDPETDQPAHVTWSHLNRNRAWVEAHLDAGSGRLTCGGDMQGPANGWLYKIHGDDLDQFTAFPSRCARCNTDWGQVGQGQNRGPIDPARSASPLGQHRTGFQKVNQVLADGLMRSLPADERRKLVVFTDSRQDAARR
jgi:hypothetical protein